MRKMRLGPELRPRSRWGSLQSSPYPLARFGEGGEGLGKRRKEKGRESKEEERKGKGGERKGGEGMARLMFSLRHRDHVTPALQQLHWLPIEARLQLKLCTLVYGIHNSQCPSYMSDVVQLVATTSTRRLRSAATINYLTPTLRSKFGERAFSYAGPAA